jgi:signal transduction histidine kinase
MIDEEGSQSRYVAVNPLHLFGGKPGFVTVISSLKPVNDLVEIHNRIRMISMVATVILLVGAIGLIFRTTVYRSIRNLVTAMNRFEAGDTTVRAEERLPDEFGELARHLNHMLEEIGLFQQSLKQQIQSATEVLAQRNRELENLNLLLYETQKRLGQAERLALIGQLTATFAHEIGSPLSAVSTHLQILLEDPQLQPAIQERVRLADSEINRLCGIVENLLASSRRPYFRNVIEVQELLQKVVHLLGPMLQARRVELTLEAEGGPFRVLGNPDLLQQLFLNLFNNSLDAIQGPGRLEISLRRVPEPASERSLIEIRIRDSGVGIPQDKLGHIFDPFFTTKEFGKGTGLGLAVSREIVQTHGGRIEVASPPSQGATFTIVLPEFVAAESESPGPVFEEGEPT